MGPWKNLDQKCPIVNINQRLPVLLNSACILIAKSQEWITWSNMKTLKHFSSSQQHICTPSNLLVLLCWMWDVGYISQQPAHQLFGRLLVANGGVGCLRHTEHSVLRWTYTTNWMHWETVIPYNQDGGRGQAGCIFVCVGRSLCVYLGRDFRPLWKHGRQINLHSYKKFLLHKHAGKGVKQSYNRHSDHAPGMKLGTSD